MGASDVANPFSFATVELSDDYLNKFVNQEKLANYLKVLVIRYDLDVNSFNQPIVFKAPWTVIMEVEILLKSYLREEELEFHMNFHKEETDLEACGSSDSQTVTDTTVMLGIGQGNADYTQLFDRPTNKQLEAANKELFSESLDFCKIEVDHSENEEGLDGTEVNGFTEREQINSLIESSDITSINHKHNSMSLSASKDSIEMLSCESPSVIDEEHLDINQGEHVNRESTEDGSKLYNCNKTININNCLKVTNIIVHEKADPPSDKSIKVKIPRENKSPFNKFYCQLCKSSFSTVNSARRHVQSFHDLKTNSEVSSYIGSHSSVNKLFYCQFCKSTYTLVKNLRFHMRRMHGLKTCSEISRYIGTQFLPKNDQLETNSHQENRDLLACSSSDKCYSISKATDTMVDIGHGNQLFVGPKDKQFDTASKEYLFSESVDLKEQFVPDDHLETTIDNDPLPKKCVCYMCEAVFEHEVELNSHLKIQHFMQVSNVKPPVKKYKQSSRKPRITDDIRCVCETCGKRVKHKRISYHMRSHTGIDFYTCDICGKQSSSKQHYQSHRLLHSDEKRFTCDICGYACKQAQGLRIHMKTHKANNKDNICSYCGQGFTKLGHLKYHIMIIHKGIKPQKCLLCDKGFWKVRKHMLQVHKRAKDDWKRDTIWQVSTANFEYNK